MEGVENAKTKVHELTARSLYTLSHAGRLWFPPSASIVVVILSVSQICRSDEEVVCAIDLSRSYSCRDLRSPEHDGSLFNTAARQKSNLDDVYMWADESLGLSIAQLAKCMQMCALRDPASKLFGYLGCPEPALFDTVVKYQEFLSLSLSPSWSSLPTIPTTFCPPSKPLQRLGPLRTLLATAPWMDLPLRTLLGHIGDEIGDLKAIVSTRPAPAAPISIPTVTPASDRGAKSQRQAKT